LVDQLLKLKTKPFFADTNTLYKCQRSNAIDHKILAEKHGFTVENSGAPFIVMDGLLGNCETAIEIDGELNKEVFIASEIIKSQSILSIAHFTGHIAVCAAANLKTVGMGCASRKGKLRQHSVVSPFINEACVLCGQCLENCPVDAITSDGKKANIDDEKCIGCGECLSVCRFDAVKFNWDAESRILQKHIAEYALGALKNKKGKAAFFNYAISITAHCDCMNQSNMEKVVDDIGILASTDPVALDKATIDMAEKHGGKKFQTLVDLEGLDPMYQLQHAEQLGLGNCKYKLIEIN
jgi:hypothetical protein